MLDAFKKYYTPEADQEDLISIGTIGLIKGISTFDASKGARLATYAARCVENEILMYFRSQRKTAGDVSLSECIETGRDGTALSLMDVICSDEDLFDDLSTRELYGRLYEAVDTVLTPREREILTWRYGLGGRRPETQREALAYIIDNGLTVAATDAYVDALLSSPEPEPPAQPDKPEHRRTFVLKDVRVFLNTLSRSIDLMKQGGIDAGIKRQETEDSLILTISIPKNKPAQT